MQGPVYLSPQRLQELKDELNNIKTVVIRQVAAQIDDAKQNGDLSENAEYQDAKERMTQIQIRAVELEYLINNAVVIEGQKSGGAITIGSKIVVHIDGTQKNYEIVGSTEADPSSGKISNESPLGQAFMGHKEGEVVEFTTPVKKNIYTILHVN